MTEKTIETELINRGFAVLSTTGFSMWPLLREGKDSVLIIPRGEIKKKDVVLFRRADDSCILHRVIRIREDSYTCCGDSEWNWEKVQPEQIIGKLKGIYRGDYFLDCQSPLYKLYVFFWCTSMKVRKIVISPINCFYAHKKN